LPIRGTQRRRTHRLTSTERVDTVELGVKNRAELDECLAAEAAPDMEPELIERIDRALGS
jgi:hypothetical protein